MSTLFTDLDIALILFLLALVFYILSLRSHRFAKLLSGRVYGLLIAGAIMLVLFNGLFANVNIESHHVFFELPIGYQHYGVSSDGIRYGIGAGLRYLTMLLGLLGFIVGTQPRDFANALEDIYCPATIATMFALTFRFIPDVNRHLGRLWDAQKSRGFIVDRRRRLGWIRVYGILVTNLLIGTVLNAQRLGLVLEMRGIGSPVKRCHWQRYYFSPMDLVVLIALVVCTATALYARYVLGMGTFKAIE
jgi:energy-coupling factor transporter transmembrane protein EcfT